MTIECFLFGVLIFVFLVFLGLILEKQKDLNMFKKLYEEKSADAIVYYEAMQVLIWKFNKQELQVYLAQFEDIVSALSQQDDAENNDMIEIYRLLADEIKLRLSSLDEWLKKKSQELYVLETFFDDEIIR